MLLNHYIPNIFERKIREYPTLAPVKNESSNTPPLRYKECESPSSHVEEVSKNVGEQGQIQSLVDTFIGQAERWWDRHQQRLQTWATTSTYFVERFRGNKLTTQSNIPFFTQGKDPEKHINVCEKEW